jgi:phenylpyruvate tautomerase PptA (4-oxalocrotonate tautomerase family)
VKPCHWCASTCGAANRRPTRRRFPTAFIRRCARFSPCPRTIASWWSRTADEDFIYEPSYLGIDHGPDFVMLQITVSNTRTVAQKQALYARIVELLEKNPGLRRQDVMINLIDVGKENWSFGNGIAQYV